MSLVFTTYSYLGPMGAHGGSHVNEPLGARVGMVVGGARGTAPPHAIRVGPMRAHGAPWAQEKKKQNKIHLKR